MVLRADSGEALSAGTLGSGHNSWWWCPLGVGTKSAWDPLGCSRREAGNPDAPSSGAPGPPKSAWLFSLQVAGLYLCAPPPAAAPQPAVGLAVVRETKTYWKSRKLVFSHFSFPCPRSFNVTCLGQQALGGKMPRETPLVSVQPHVTADPHRA